MRGVEVELGGKSRRLRYDFNAVADLEEKAGKGVGVLFSEDYVGFHVMRLMIWAGLKHETPGLTPHQVGQWLSEYVSEGGNLESLGQSAQDALIKSGLGGNVTAGEE